MSEVLSCPSCGKPPGQKVGPPAMVRCITDDCPGKKLAAVTLTEWNSRADGVTVTIFARGDNENTPAEAVHHALEYARKAGFIEAWSDVREGAAR